MLGLKELRVARVQSWLERVAALVADSNWLDALSLALDHYDECLREIRDTAALAEERARQHAHNTGGIVDMRRIEALRARQPSKHVQDKLAQLLMQYVHLMFSHAPAGDGDEPVSPGADAGTSTGAGAGAGAGAGTTGGVSPSAAAVSKKMSRGLKRYLNHYAVVGGVCVEFCVVTNRTDLLFGDIFDLFCGQHKEHELLKLLEPYILNDRIQQLKPVVMQAFVTYYRSIGALSSIERCLLHLDLSTLDINAAVQVCVQHKLFSALVNVYNRGLMDYTTPIDLLLVPVMERVVPATGGDASSTAMTTPGGAQPAEHTTAVQKLLARTDEEQRRIGYKLLLYLQYCLLGRAFPRGDVPPHILPTLRADVMSFLFEERPATFPCFGDTLTFASTHGGAAAAGVRSAAGGARKRPGSHLPGPFPRVQALCQFDTKAFLDVITVLFDESAAAHIFRATMSGEDPEALPPGEEVVGRPRSDSGHLTHTRRGPSLQSIVDALTQAMLPFGPQLAGRGAGGGSGRRQSSYPAPQAAPSHTASGRAQLFTEAQMGELFTFMAHQMSRNGSSITTGPDVLQRIFNFLARRTAATATGTTRAAELAASRQLTLVKLLEKRPLPANEARTLLQRVEAAGFFRAAVVLHKQAGEFAKVLDSYISDHDPTFSVQVFDYILQEIAALANERMYLVPGAPIGGVASGDAPTSARGGAGASAGAGAGSGGGDGDDGDSDGMFAADKLAVLHMLDTILNEEGQRRLASMKRVVLVRLHDLIELGEGPAANLIMELFPKEGNQVVSKLEEFPELQYKYLKQVMVALKEEYTQEPPSSDATRRMVELLKRKHMKVSPDMHLQYVELLCRYNPQAVYDHISRQEHQYPLAQTLDATLALVTKHKVINAQAYVLESTGGKGVTSALDLLLGNLRARLAELEPVAAAADTETPAGNGTHPAGDGSGDDEEKVPVDSAEAPSSPPNTMASMLNMPERTFTQTPPGFRTLQRSAEYKAAASVLQDAIELCGRNSSFTEQRSEALWFSVLDCLVEHHRRAKQQTLAEVRRALGDDTLDAADARVRSQVELSTVAKCT